MLILVIPILAAVAIGLWLLVLPRFETLTVHGGGDQIYLIDAHGHRIHGNRYTTTFHDGDQARCRVRRFPILMPAVIEECKSRR